MSKPIEILYWTGFTIPTRSDCLHASGEGFFRPTEGSYLWFVRQLMLAGF